jgi:hypothetical protein
VDPHSFLKLDPEPHSPQKLDPDPHQVNADVKREMHKKMVNFGGLMCIVQMIKYGYLR